MPDMHEAYRRVRLDQTAYGCFMMGPSATLVHGAQGACVSPYSASGRGVIVSVLRPQLTGLGGLRCA